MLEDRVERGHVTRRDTFSAHGRTAPANEPRLGGCTRSDVGLSCFNIAELGCLDHVVPEQGSDGRLNPAAIHSKCGRLDRLSTATNDPSGLSPFEMPVADLAHGMTANLLDLFNRICTFRDFAKHHVGAATGLLDRHQAEATQRRFPEEQTRTFDRISRRFQSFYQTFGNFRYRFDTLADQWGNCLFLAPDLPNLLTS